MPEEHEKEIKSVKVNLKLLLILLYGFLSNLYLVVRYHGLVADSDVGFFTKSIQAVQSQGTIFSAHHYTNGFGVQVIITFLSDITGLSIQQLQILPIGFLYILIAYPLFIELTKDKNIALLATFLLCLQPDLLFLMSRGSHERFTFFLALMALFILMRLAIHEWNDKRGVSYLVIFYMTVFSLTALNNWFAALIILAIIFTSITGFIISKLFEMPGSPYKKVLYAVIPGIPLYYCISQYVYPTMGKMMWSISNIWIEKLMEFGVISILIFLISTILVIIAMIFIRSKVKVKNILKNQIMKISERIHTNQLYHMGMYTLIGFGLLAWLFGVYVLSVSSNVLCFPPNIWFFLTSFNWFVIPLSVVMTLTIVWNFMNENNINNSHIMLLSFYISLILLLLMAIFIDRTISIGDNLELRVFPYLMFFVIGLASMLLLRWLDRLQTKKWRNTIKVMFTMLIIMFVVISLVKATNDPLVTDFCIFYSGGEKTAMNWMESNLEKTTIWAEFADRISAAFNYESGFDSYGKLHFTDPKGARYYFLSDIIRKRAERSDYTLPTSKDFNKIYDNNEAELFYRGRKA